MFKRMISLIAVLAILSTACCVSAFAAIDYTKTYYMNGYKNYGHTVMTSTQVSSNTYSENVGYAKAVEFDYYYYYNHSLLYLTRGNIDTFVTNGFNDYSVGYTYTTTSSEYIGAIGKHAVKATSYMIWSSHASEDDSVVGSVTPDYSDV